VTTIWTIGYQKLFPQTLVAELEAAGVSRVLDVRLRPQSRRPGMSKTRLGALLAEHGIAYEHRRELGTPLEIRGLYRAGHSERAAAAYRDHIENNAAREVDDLAGSIAVGPRTALLCLEENPAECHRRVLTEALRTRVADLEVVDL
jgi:uncharacterized protein (DUF488 family)